VVHSVGHGQVDITSNWTKSFSRVNLNIGVSYATDLDAAIAVVNRVGKELAEDPQFKGKVLQPPHVLRVDRFTDFGVELKIVGETAPIEQWTVMGELRLRLKKAFDAEGIEMPFIPRATPAAAAATSARADAVPDA
jgi:small conductance mechanosensitive channel